jgi:transglutaminase-like putative cysteine protease
MRIRVRHETRYTYATPAISALQLLRMTPRPHDGQFVRRWRVEVDADARLAKSEDAYGNITHLVFLSGPVDGVLISITGEVDITDTAGVINGSVERQPTQLFRRRTALTDTSPAIAAFARAVASAKPGRAADRPLDILHRLNASLHDAMEFRIGSTATTTSAGQAFAAKSGVCQDFAHIFIVATRLLGIPARYVGGYYLRSDAIDQDAGHAWAEAYIDGLGWVGFDPAHGVCVTDRYVRVAIGADYLDASPVRGAQVGGADETLAVKIEIAEAMTQSQSQSQSQGQGQSQSQKQTQG